MTRSSQLLAYGHNIHRYDKYYVKGEGKLNLAFFILYLLFDVIIIHFFRQICCFDNQGTHLQLSFILALTRKIWYVINGTLKNTFSDLVARELNSIKAVHHHIYVCQYDWKYLTINFTLLTHKFNCCVTSFSTNCV